MGKTLILAEKPSVAADIAKALGDFRQVERNVFERADVIVTSARGHCVKIDIAKQYDKGWDISALPVIPPEFTLEAIKESAGVLKTIKSQINRADVSAVVNACDAGREGELIFGLIAAFLGCRKPMHRMWLQSMTHEAIRDAYEHMTPASEWRNLLDAAKCRSEADLLIGVNGTRALTYLYRQRVNSRHDIATAGRVQTPVLAIICDREHAIRHFKPRDFWEVHGTFRIASGTYSGKWQRPDTQDDEDRYRLWTPEEAQNIVQRCQGVMPTSVREKKELVKRAPPRLFDLTSLQREANKRFGFTASDTLKFAQSLYETHKVLTYPRTDSSALPEDYVDTARQLMGNLAKDGNAYARQVIDGEWIKPDKRIFNNAKISDHFAIIPTMTLPESLSKEEQDIYTMVVKRFIAVFYPPAEYERTVRWTDIRDDVFFSAGRVLVQGGWLVVYGQEAVSDDDDLPGLCAYQQGESVANQEIELVSGKTKPPSRFTEATLLGVMETAGKLLDDESMREAMAERGLGTPATRAAIIEALVSPMRGYVARQKKELVPTEKGMEIIGVLRDIGLDLMTSPALTGEWEARLRYMEQGKVERPVFMREITDMTRSIVEHIRGRLSTLPAADKKAVFSVACPKCGDVLNVDDRTVSCGACDFKLWRTVAGKSLSDEQLVRLLSDGNLPEMSGFRSKAGKSFSAGLHLVNGGGGKVEFVFSPQNTKQRSAVGAKESAKPCPKCGNGRLVERKSARGAFLGCTGYPNCKYTEQI